MLASVLSLMPIKLVVDSVLASKEDSTVSYFQSWLCSFELGLARRQANHLAKATSLYACPSDWHSVRDFISSVLASDCKLFLLN